MEHKVFHLKGGTKVVIGEGWLVTTLPCGTEIHAHPNGASKKMANQLGCRSIKELTEQHDLLHALLCSWLGVESQSLKQAAGLPCDHTLANYEEDVVLALQRFINALEGKPHECKGSIS